MVKKSYILMAVLLAFGVGMIPGGILIDSAINETVENSVDDGLLGIERKAIPLIEPMIKEKGIPRALRGIRDIGIPILEDMVEVTFVAVLINTFAIMGGEVFGTFYDPIGSERFFNNESNGVWVIFNGISAYYGEPLNYTEEAQSRILYGNSTSIGGYVSGIQGFLNDTSTGEGVTNFLVQYITANSSVTTYLSESMQDNYNCSWYQLTMVYEYVVDYLIEVIIPIIIANNLHVDYMPELAGLLSVNAIAKALFMEQWANGTVLNEVLYEGGIDFCELVEFVNETLIGFEVGRTIPSNITRQSAYALFDETNYPNALTNDTGIEKWILAPTNNTIKTSLLNEFNLTQSQIDKILFWLFKESFKDNIVPELMKLPPPEGVGANISEYARAILLEQWANGTVLGDIMYPYGFPLSLKAGVVFGFEVGYRGRSLSVMSSNMSFESVESLWDITNEYSLVNDEGLNKWYMAVADSTSKVAENLQNLNSLEYITIEMILSWLPKFRGNLMPYLAQEEYDLPMDSTSLGDVIALSMIITSTSLIGISGLIATNILLKRRKK
jgi:hypothetical protein